MVQASAGICARRLHYITTGGLQRFLFTRVPGDVHPKGMIRVDSRQENEYAVVPQQP